MIWTATLEFDFTATTDAAQWVQIYGLLRPTDANETGFRHLPVQFSFYMNRKSLQTVSLFSNSIFMQVLQTCFVQKERRQEEK